MLKDWNRGYGDVYLKNGSRMKCISGEKPARFRGPQFHGGWLDELATFQRPEAFDQARIIMRLPGEKPQLLVTTTPAPVPLIRKLLDADGVIISRGQTSDNSANLSDDYLSELELMYGGTRLWRQEILGELLEDVPGALWIAEYILHEDAPLDWKRKVVAVDPAVTNTETSDETGIIVAGQAHDNRLGVIADYTTKDSIFGYAKRVLEAYRVHQCDVIVYEDNQGGTAVAEILRSIDPYAPVKPVHAYIGKELRAAPIAALYEQHKVFHVKQRDADGRIVNQLAKLEDQMLTWNPEEKNSPDRLDAMVHALTELAGKSQGSRFLLEIAEVCGRCQMPNEKGSMVCRSCGAGLTPSGKAPDVVNQWKGVSRG